MSLSSSSWPYSAQCLDCLKETTLATPALGREMVYELTPPYGDSSEALQQLFVDAIQDELLSISLSRNITSSECGRHISLVYELLSMMNPSAQMADLDLDGLFTDLIQAALGKTISPGLVNKSWVYACLLGRSNNYLVTRFCEVEDHLWSSQGMLPLSQPDGIDELQVNQTDSLDMAITLEEKVVWKELYHQAMFDGYHVLEHIIVSNFQLQSLLFYDGFGDIDRK